MNTNMKEIFEIANKLSNEDMVTLINIFADRICVFRVSTEGFHVDDLDREQPCHLNGANIQINLSGVFDESEEAPTDGS